MKLNELCRRDIFSKCIRAAYLKVATQKPAIIILLINPNDKLIKITYLFFKKNVQSFFKNIIILSYQKFVFMLIDVNLNSSLQRLLRRFFLSRNFQRDLNRKRRCPYFQALANIFLPAALRITPWEPSLIVEWVSGRAGKFTSYGNSEGYTLRSRRSTLIVRQNPEHKDISC